MSNENMNSVSTAEDAAEDSVTISSATGTLTVTDMSASAASEPEPTTFRLAFTGTDGFGREIGDATIDGLHAVNDTNNDDVSVLLASNYEDDKRRAWLEANAGMRLEDVSLHIRADGMAAGINAMFSNADISQVVDFIKEHAKGAALQE